MTWGKNSISELSKRIIAFAQKPIFVFLAGMIAFADVFIFVIPIDALVVTSALAVPRRWLFLGLSFSIGSTLGAIAFVSLVKIFGEPFIRFLAPTLMDSSFWRECARWFASYGLWMLFGISALPVAQPPILAMSGLSQLPLLPIAAILTIGRTLKYVGLCWIAAKSPQWLPKGLRAEVEEIKTEVNGNTSKEVSEK